MSLDQAWAEVFRAMATSYFHQISWSTSFVLLHNVINKVSSEKSPLQIIEFNITHMCFQIQHNFFTRALGTSNNNVNNDVMWHLSAMTLFLNLGSHLKHLLGGPLVDYDGCLTQAWFRSYFTYFKKIIG